MKTCPFCAEEIQDAAIVCKHCGRDIAPTTVSTRDAKGKSELGIGTILLAAVAAIGTLWFMAAQGDGVPAAPVEESATLRPGRVVPGSKVDAPPAAPEPLYLLAMTDRRSSDRYHTVEGRVLNASSSPMDRLRVQVTWFTDDGTFITTDEAMVDYQPVMPGQTSPFKTITTHNPAMARYNVAFVRAGKVVEHADRRQKQ